MIQNWLIQLVINFVLTKLADLTTSLDWAALLAEAEAYIEKFVPAFLKSAVDGVVAAAIAALQAALSDAEDIKTIMEDLAKADWKGALATLEALLAKAVHPGAPAVLAVVSTMKV